MKPLVAAASLAALFILAGIGWFSGLSIWALTVRATLGAGILYVVLRLAGAIVVRTLAEAVTRNLQQSNRAGSSSRVDGK